MFSYFMHFLDIFHLHNLLFFDVFILLESITERERKRVLHLQAHSTKGRNSQSQARVKLAERRFFQISNTGAGALGLDHSIAFAGHQQQAGLEVECPEQEPAPTWDTSTTDEWDDKLTNPVLPPLSFLSIFQLLFAKILLFIFNDNSFII